MNSILIIDDDKAIRRTLEVYLRDRQFNVYTAGSLADGLEVWKTEQPDLILLDLMLPDGTGMQLLQDAEQNQIPVSVIMITGHQDHEKAITAMQLGAFDYIHKPIELDELDLAVDRVFSMKSEKERSALITDIEGERKPGKIIGSSAATLDLLKQIGQASRGKVNVLITGESGTGKELVARAIHRNTTPDEPLISVNCSAIVPTLLESELFGHEKGAFTDAKDRKIGKIELAGEGTLFLDEIGDMDLKLQAKLLRVLQEREFQRVGGSKTIPLNARIVTATNQNLESLIEAGIFREDLYYRLKVIEIKVKPLRKRKADIPDLVDYFLSDINHILHRNVSRVPRELMNAMIGYDWPGNVRELENTIAAGIMRSPGETLQLELPNHRISSSGVGAEYNWKRSLDDVEREHIQAVLKAVDGRLGDACEVLGISRPTLRKKMQEYGLKDSFN